MVMTNIRRYIYQLINGRSSRGILAWCGMENTSGSARAIDQKGIHFPGKAEDAEGVEGASLLQKVRVNLETYWNGFSDVAQTERRK